MELTLTRRYRILWAALLARANTIMGMRAPSPCGYCGDRMTVRGKTRCRPCLDTHAAYVRYRMQRRREKGACGVCDRIRPLATATLCAECRLNMRVACKQRADAAYGRES